VLNVQQKFKIFIILSILTPESLTPETCISAIRNPNVEIRNKFKIRILQCPKRKLEREFQFFRFGHLDFDH
jgi:hypothetical protein